MENEEEQEEQSGGGLQLDAIKSYVAFAWRAIRARWLWVVSVCIVGLTLTATTFHYLPRTYNCTTVLMGQANQVLEGWGAPMPFVGVGGLIKRHENLENIIKETKLVSKYDLRRPPLLKLKDRLLAKIFGPTPDEVKAQILLGTLEGRLQVMTDGTSLTISVDWSDGQTAAEVAAAARDSYLKTRRAADLAAFQEKMAILDGHATKLRTEVETLAKQIQAARQEAVEKATKAGASASGSPAPSAPPVRMTVRKKSLPDLEQPALRERLANSKARLRELDGERDRRLREERAKLADLKLRLAGSHPDVLMADQRIALLLQEPSEVALLRAEIRSLEGELEHRQALAGNEERTVFRNAPSSGGGAPAAEALPDDIVALLEETEADPALVAQLSGAVAKYGALRSDIRSGSIELDTAQAAFNHRYKLIVPAEVPGVPVKPRFLTVFGQGLIVTLLLALLVPIVMELRTGIIVERWQVQRVQLPVLAELRLPPPFQD